jgi:hypothetical protein
MRYLAGDGLILKPSFVSDFIGLAFQRLIIVQRCFIPPKPLGGSLILIIGETIFF